MPSAVDSSLLGVCVGVGSLRLFSGCKPGGEQNRKNTFSVALDEGQYNYGYLLAH